MTKVVITLDTAENVRFFPWSHEARTFLLLAGFLPSDDDRHSWEQPLTGHKAKITYIHEEHEAPHNDL